ncbi:MAG: MgtC/SapB family protein [Pseudonocardiaceae bacterium]
MTAQAVVQAAGQGQGWRQVGELLVAFGLSSVIGLEREIRGKSAGLRTQAIVGTSAALILLVSKYGFFDVLVAEQVVLDPSRVAAQIVSGVGFLGAGLIITRQGAVRGLTTAAAVWETAAIGMAAGAGMALLAVVVTGLHFVIVLGFTLLTQHLPGAHRGTVHLHVTYEDSRGVLRHLLAACTSRRWVITSLAVGNGAQPEALGEVLDSVARGRQRQVNITLTLTGDDVANAATVLAAVDGVSRITRTQDDRE